MKLNSVTSVQIHGDNLSIKAKLKNISWIYIFLIVVLASIGFVILYSAGGGNFKPWASAQIIRFSAAFMIIIIIALTNLRFWVKQAYNIYLICLFLLLLVEFLGHTGMGAQRWINLGFIQIQPAELMKIAAVLALARYYNGKSLEEARMWRSLPIPLLLVALPAVLVIKQPDLGTTVMLAVSAGVILWLVGVQWWKFGLIFVLALIASPFVWNFMLHDYQKKRVFTFLDPEKDPLGAGYHILQSYITLGSGGITGKGFLQGTQSSLNFLPEKHTDFIFTVLAEDFGLIGELLLLFIYLALIAVGFYIAVRCANYFGKIVALGLTANLFFYMFINIAMVIGIVPVVGIPLPLISYGGTAMLTHLISFGLIECVFVNRDIRIGKRGAYDD